MVCGKSTMIYIFLALVLTFGLSKYVLYQLVSEWTKDWVNTGSWGIKLGTKRANLTILLWDWPFGQVQKVEGDMCMDMYRVPGCNVVDNRNLLNRADVVVFHNRELIQGQSRLPLEVPRPPGQMWVWFTLESPSHNGNLRPFAGAFNWTMTYQRNADIYMPYGVLIPRKEKIDYIIPDKNTLACWTVSVFQTYHRRAGVYYSLKELMPLEVYGRFGNRPLDSSQLLPTISRCYFYMAFENSIHRDYITEKLWHNAFESGSVPVVLGPPRSNYEAFIPKDSFIHVDDFNSTAELAAFLKQLATDKERYESYLHWHQYYDIKIYLDWREMFCKICSDYEGLPPSKVYDDLHTWHTTEQ